MNDTVLLFIITTRNLLVFKYWRKQTTQCVTNAVKTFIYIVLNRQTVAIFIIIITAIALNLICKTNKCNIEQRYPA